VILFGVIPAKAGTQNTSHEGLVSATFDKVANVPRASALRNAGWVPAYAGMTEEWCNRHQTRLCERQENAIGAY
jgi:hypothetical protein